MGKKIAERGIPRVLIVDDDADCADMLVELLAQSGYDARSAGDGASGLAAVANFDPHFVLLDMRMPGVDGAEFVRHLSANEGPHARRVVIVSSGLPRYAVQGVSCDHYLPKPIELPDLLAILETEWQAKFASTPYCM